MNSEETDRFITVEQRLEQWVVPDWFHRWFTVYGVHRYSERLVWLEAVWPARGVRRRNSLADSSHNTIEVSMAVPRNSA